MDFLISVAGKIAEYAIEPVGRQFGYLIYYNSNIETLRSKVEKLEDESATVAALADADKRNGKLIRPNVQDWQTSVQRIREESTEFLNTQVNQNQKCFSRQLPCPDLVSRYRVSRKSSKKSLQVDGLLNDRINFGDQVSTPAPPPPVRAMFPGDIEAFDSRKSTFEAIMKALEDDEVNMIGVYGMGGIGKTTMVKQVAKEAEKLKLFDEFAMAVVSQKPDVRKIQSEIAKMLGLTFDDQENEFARAGRLVERMENGKKILMVLDDLWDGIDLAKIGITGRCCKIILTSRHLNVCNKMKCERFILIEVLSPTDAFGYFRANAGDAVDSSDLRPIATEIVKKCAGLPIAIKTIGLALTGKRQHEYWEDVLEQLRNFAAENIEGVRQDVYGVLEVSYNLLDSHDLRYCFLICSLFEEDANISIEDLVRYGLGLNLFQTRNRAHVLVDKLKDRSLLMKGETDKSVTMHDVFRELAHYLASRGREHVFLVRQGEDITEWPGRDKCGDYTAISLLSHEISELPEGLDCPKLQILIFEQQWVSILKIPMNFFQGMKQLRVLKMSKCSMTSIPASIALLEGLETLCLENSELEDLSQIGGLKKLKVLSLAGSDFEELPREIGLLTNLMILDLTGCEELKVVPPNLISNLIKLECLYVLNRWNQWSWGGSNATVGELKHLHHLNTLEMDVRDINLLPNDLPFQKLIRFRVYIGNYKQDYWGLWRDLWRDLRRDLRRDLEKMLVIQLVPDHNNTLPTGVKTLMKGAQALVVEFKGYNYPTEEYPHPSALSDLNEDGFKNLKYLEVKENYNMKYLIDSSNASTPTFFPLLEELLLEKLGLNELCRDDLPDGSFGELRKLKLSYLPNLTKLWSMNDSGIYVNLRSVEISRCKELKHVFPQSASALLGQLESLTVMDCESLEGIFLEDRPEMDDIIHLPKLQILKIHRVPSLKGQLFDTKILLPALEELDFSGLDQSQYIWLIQLLLESSCILRKINISDCKSIVTVFPSNVQHCLQNLASLSIIGCESLEAVLEADITSTSMLPQLQQQHHNLDQLRQPKLPRGFPSLKEINISNCPKMKAFAAAATTSMVDYNAININVADLTPFFNETVDLPVLENLYISGVEGVEELWHDKSQAASLRELSLSNLPKLTELWWNKDCSGKFSCPDLCSLKIYGCHGLRNIFLPSAIKHGMNIQNLKIRNCSNMEEVVGEEEHGEYSRDKLLFRRVEELSLLSLPNLRTFCRGNYILEWPSLSKMDMDGCPNMTNFCLGPVITPLLKGLSENEFTEELWKEGSNLNDIIQHPYFNKIVLSSYMGHSSLELRDLHDVKELGHPQLFSIEMFRGLTSVTVSNCNSLVTIFPSSVLRRLNHLKTICIENCELVEEVFGFHDEDAATVSVSAMMMMIPLRDIYLDNLPNLVQFGQLGTVEFSHLRTLKIMDCPKMKTFPAAHKHNLSGDFIQPFFQEKVDLSGLEVLYISGVEGVEDLWHDRSQAGSLRELPLSNLPKLTELWWNKDHSGKFSCPNLRSLEVSGCHGLRNIFVPSAIKHDMNIQYLTIRDCSNMEEVVGEEEQGEYSEDKLLFRLVKKLSLENLPNLRTFYRGNYILEWPSLSKMVMNDCPNMAKFCLGPVITPLLKGLSINEYNDEVWMEGSNLNDIIQHPYFNKIVFSGQGRLELRDLHDVKELRELSLIKLFSIEGFRRITRVKVSNCNSLVTIFPSSVLRRLNNLESICIENCELVEEVFGFHDEDVATVMMMMIPFQDICLVNLPNLVHFGQLGTVEFSLLKKLTIMDCPKMKTFLAAHKHNLSGDFIQPFFQEKVDLHVLEELYISGVEGVKDLWHDRSQTGSLRELSLIELPKLTELWWNKDRSGKFSCPDLRSLTVARCHGLRNIFVPSAIKHDMNIQKLTIADCSNMEEVVGEEEHGEYSGDKLLFRLVEELSLENLPNLRTFCRGNYNLEWPSLSKMVMNNCPNMAKFCLGPVSTPLLKGLSEKGDNEEVLREGSNLNDIIQHLYNQKEIAAKEKQEEETSGTREAHLE